MKTEYKLINPYEIDTSDPDVTYDVIVDTVAMVTPDHMVITLRILPVAE